MAVIIPFKAIRPRADLTERIAALPYDVYNSKEARAVVEKEPLSFLKIDRAETAFEEGTSPYEDKVYTKAHDMLWDMFDKGEFVQDEKAGYYIYELTMDGRSQTGIVACASVDDYINDVIKKHENTRADKEEDRIRHVDTCGAQTGPIFIAYRKNDVIKEITDRVKKSASAFDFTSDDGIGHRGWIIDGAEDIETIRDAFEKMDALYIADGHHRTASAAKVSLKRRQENPGYTGDEEFNYFLSVLFPDDELRILDYNRVIKDLNGLTEEELLSELEASFDVQKADAAVSPAQKGEFGLYLKNSGWYVLKAHDDIKSDDPVKGLDVSIIHDAFIAPVLGIEDPKTDKRIDFVGGIRGLKELERRANDDCVMAISMYPTGIDELFAVADAKLLMPPKSTWFEPKLRSGLFIHDIR
ncbi:MAG: DUF1015 domain-containing protein [Lachnospiraceae bacterium]|nr:DUF1015 domain-containing protein [Lachnospiraceae bacterium]